MIEIIETMMPSSSIDISVALLIISICALVDILSPGVLAITGYLLLTQPNQLSSRLFVFLFVIQLGYFMIGILLYFGGDTLLGLIENLSEFDFINWFYTVTGTLLVLVSFIKPKESTIERLTSWIPRQTTIKGIIILGIIVFLIEFVTALPYFYSIFLLNHLSINSFSSIFVIIGYNFVMVLPSLLLLGISIVFKDKLQHFLRNIKTKLNEAPISSVLVAIGVVGAVFFNIGIRGILN
ncbi:GAP family protein [Pallidibacillus thermolactis]|uniref:GAP family protein n=1 Tax=Pallidibacillus thermolactis TaxID=251051 RepID=UPI0021DB7C82|nr:GAP family protein [Pallidibacillus thermolactis]MCU9602123.1 GAP family protein [Pallidibacillus thermolactis subsp. kokeshiiformis]